MLDVLVIGAGLSGLMAAYTAASAGLKVKVIAKGLGTIHWSAATIDLLGYMPGDANEAVYHPLQRIGKVIQDDPDHPYAFVGMERLTAALETFQALSREVGLPYVGAPQPGDNLWLPSPAGACRPAFLAPQAQANGDVNRPEPMLIVGFQGLRDFYPQLIAENLNRQGYKARAALLPLDLLTTRRDYSTVHLAQALDDPERRPKLGAALRKLVAAGERVGLPAILGQDQHAAVMADLQQQVGATLFEIPTLPPSVPGIRLTKALRAKLDQLGVRTEVGMEVIASQATAPHDGAAGHVEWVETATSARPLRHRARNFVLATGGILGGGFGSDYTGKVWEVVFDLPLTVPQSHDQWFNPEFLNPAGHPVFHGGVAVNHDLQPVNGAGQPIYDNLWAVGELLAHDNPIQQRGMEGAAVVTGVTAGHITAQQLTAAIA